MKASEVRRKFIDFFKNEPRNHKEISPAPLVLENDPTTLFTSSGMQPLIPYLMGEPHPSGSKRLVDSQPSIRLQDIDEVGDNRHTTFFEMLGNWSLGDYFKEEQLPWIYEFLTKELGLPGNKLWISVFEGDNKVPKDVESVEVWKKIRIPENQIFYYGVKNNWWSRSGTPDKMPIGEIGGPDSEVFFDFGEELKMHENSIYKNEHCHPNCNCGRFLEIGNSVFIQYKKVGENHLEELPNKNVDFGGGLERITAAVNNTPDVFRIDLFQGIISDIESKFGGSITYGKDPEKDKSIRIIAEHMRASSMLISSGITPGNKEHAYILRKLIRRALFHAYLLTGEIDGKMLPVVHDQDKYDYPLNLKSGHEITKVIDEEAGRFARTLGNGLSKLRNAISHNIKIDGRFAFDLYQTDGFPLELTSEILHKEKIDFLDTYKESFEKEFEKHKELSRTTSAGVFKGGLADKSAEVIKLHTATHLLLASLRKVLGDQVVQKGQNITRERSRFDFPNPGKLTDEELKKVEDMINKVISDDLPVKFEILPKEEAIKTGAIHAFNEKYADTVKVYYVGENLKNAISREFCGGPHVKNTGEIGRVRIKKQEKIGSGLMRVYLVLENR